MLRRPRCFVTTAVLFLTEQLAGVVSVKKTKKKKKKVRSQTVTSEVSGQWKDDPSSVAGCLVRISGPTFVCSAAWSYPPIIHVGVLSTERPGSLMAIILAGERPSRSRQEAEAKL